MMENTEWAEASGGVWERLSHGDLWSLRYRMGEGVWERQGPHPYRLRWVESSTRLNSAQSLTDDLISRYYGERVDNAVTDVIPRGMDHMSALGMMRSVRRQASSALAMIEDRSSPYDRDAAAMRRTLSLVVELLSQWDSRDV